MGGWRGACHIFLARALTVSLGKCLAAGFGSVFGVSASGLVESKDNGRSWSAALMAYLLPKSFLITGAEKAPPDRREKSLAGCGKIDPQRVFLSVVHRG